MKPAGSIVFFTVSAGAGYGLLFWLGLLRAAGQVPGGVGFALAALVLALVLVSAGLLASLLHLGHAERAWRALSQWRSSWLSREGVAAIVTYVPAVLCGLCLLLGVEEAALVFGLVAAVCAVVTVYCTAMIYASLKPIKEWAHPLVPAGYLVLSLFAGAVLLALLTAFAGADASVPALQALIFGALSAALKWQYWRSIDTARPIATIETATGLGRVGATKPLDPPHTQTNYLLREMGFRLARKHAAKLRGLALWAGLMAPALLAALALAAGGMAAGLFLALAAVLALGGLLVERWLMFAEATHTVTLFYRGV
jgi:sulfite dehydrogenase (quinone) subunit SoeC